LAIAHHSKAVRTLLPTSTFFHWFITDSRAYYSHPFGFQGVKAFLSVANYHPILYSSHKQVLGTKVRLELLMVAAKPYLINREAYIVSALPFYSMLIC
jgi:hypothetical protein